MSRKSYAIVGTGQFGNYLAKTLTEHGQDVMVVDEDHSRLQPVEDIVNRTVIGDISDEAMLQEIGIRNFDVVVVASSHDVEKSLMAATVCKDLGCSYIIAKAASPLHAKMLQRLGVDKVVFPDLDVAARLWRSLVSRSLLDYIAVTNEFSIIEVRVPREFIGKTLAQLRLRERYSVNIALIKAKGKVSVPEGGLMLGADDQIVILGRDVDLEQFEHDFSWDEEQ